LPVQSNPNKCISCGGCVSVCPANALELRGSDIVVDTERCIDCETCMKFCPVNALRKKQQEKGLIYPMENEE